MSEWSGKQVTLTKEQQAFVDGIEEAAQFLEGVSPRAELLTEAARAVRALKVKVYFRHRGENDGR